MARENQQVEPMPVVASDQSAHGQAVRLMATWIAAIADQIKNPVAGISAAATLIEKEMASFRAARPWDPSIVEEAVRLMIERLGRFDNYLAELSGFTRSVNLRPTWIDLKHEWSSIEHYLARRVAGDYRITAKMAESGMIFADLECLKTMIAALVLNAIESCGAIINPEITVEMRQVRGDVDRMGGVAIQIKDNGPGFSKDALAQALVPFFTTKEAGTGLGLAMVDKYARAHGGWVSIDALASGGAMIEIFFPNPSSEHRGQ